MTIRDSYLLGIDEVGAVLPSKPQAAPRVSVTVPVVQPKRAAAPAVHVQAPIPKPMVSPTPAPPPAAVAPAPLAAPITKTVEAAAQPTGIQKPSLVPGLKAPAAPKTAELQTAANQAQQAGTAAQQAGYAALQSGSPDAVQLAQAALATGQTALSDAATGTAYLNSPSTAASLIQSLLDKIPGDVTAANAAVAALVPYAGVMPPPAGAAGGGGGGDFVDESAFDEDGGGEEDFGEEGGEETEEPDEDAEVEPTEEESDESQDTGEEAEPADAAPTDDSVGYLSSSAQGASQPGALRSELAGISDADWTKFAYAMRTADAGSVSPSNALGMFELKPRRLADLGLVSNLSMSRAPNGRLIWVGEFIKPMTAKKFLSNPVLQYKAFSESMRRYAKALGANEIPVPVGGRPKEMTLSGALSILHRAGPNGLKNWNDESNRFEDTVALYSKANGIF